MRLAGAKKAPGRKTLTRRITKMAVGKYSTGVRFQNGNSGLSLNQELATRAGFILVLMVTSSAQSPDRQTH
jgi:hypothetical protein